MATYKQTTGVSIQSAFEKFHRENPIVYRLIVQDVDKRIRGGAKKLSIKRVVNDLRWDVKITTKETNLFEVAGEEKKFKIGDQYISRYARLLIREFPYMAEYIEMRKIRNP